MCKLPVYSSLVIFFTVVFCLNGVVLAQSDTMPTLRGDDAVRELKQNGGYDSLLDAMKTARGDQELAPETVVPWTKLNASDGATSDRFGHSVAISGDTAVVGAYTDDVGVNTDQGSAYVFVRSGTTWIQQAQLTASDGTASDRFGVSVAISGDTIVIGANLDDVGANIDQGSVYVFVRSGTAWTQQTKLIATDGSADDRFGSTAAILGDTAIVGAFRDDVGANTDRGSAYVFVRSGTVWSQEAQLTASDGASFDSFGISVALSGDIAFVGAYLDDIGTNTNQGSAYVFVRSGTTWTEQAKLTASDGMVGDAFGWSIAISGDTAVVTAVSDDVGSNTNQGSTYVFTRSGTTWSQQAKLTASDGGINDNFGNIVAIDGDTVIVGASIDDIGTNSDQGSAYVFVRSGTTWTQATKLTASDGTTSDFFAASVAIGGDTILIGANGDDVGGNTDQGSVYAFRILVNNWVQESKNVASDGTTSDFFAASVAISGDTAVVGAPGDDIGTNTDQGSAYVFVRSGTTWSQQATLTASDGAANDDFGYSVAISGDTVIIGAPWADIDTNTEQGSAYVFVRSGTSWTQQAKLTASDGAALDGLGYSVAISGDTAVVGASGDDIGPNTAQGSAYVFVRSGTTWSQQAILTASDGAAYNQLGRSVAFSGDTVIIGAPFADIGVNGRQGSAYVFVRSGTSWTQQAKLTASDGAIDDYFGLSVAISGDTAVVGAPAANTDRGSAYVYVRSGTNWIQQAKLTALDGAAGDYFGYSVAISGDTAVVGVPDDDIGSNIDQGSAYVFVRSGTTWSQLATLTASDGAAFDLFGQRVAVSGDTVVVGAFRDDVGTNTDQGSAYFFRNVTVAADVSVSGRVRTSLGRGIANALVTISGPNGFSRSVRTGRLGSFFFNGVPNNQQYSVSVGQRRFTFSPQVLNINSNVSNLDFIAGH
ncbi:MAG TPA: carboxypeptidase regulatory-like domain-containing protein [Pyrinomonadaceae bacterium]|nr:carboxypeptidase regulatory-like domain-containing protein [Pyrinomonadaceae bacterium]